MPPPSSSPVTPAHVLLGVTGVLGGLAVGKMAVDYFLVVGLDDRERQTMTRLAKVGIAGAVVFGVASYYDIDPMWWNLDAALQAGDAWLNGGTKKAGRR